MVDVGCRLRHVREMHGLTQRALALKTGVNHSTISLIEQNRMSPSVGILKRILEGIPLSMSAFFAEEQVLDPGKFHFRRDELIEISSNDAISLRQVGGDLSERALQIMHERYAPKADSGAAMLTHEGEEGGIVIHGQIELTVAGKSVILETGDAYYVDSRLPHRFRNPGDELAEVISVCTPPTF